MLRITLLFASVLAAASTYAAPDASAFRLGPWTLGMTREQVTAVPDTGPYVPVESTGGLETRGGVFESKPATFSFVFGDNGLRYVQLWAYEGKNYEDAKQAALTVANVFFRDLGGLSQDRFEANGKPFPPDLVPQIVDSTLGKARDIGNEIKKKHKSAILFTFDVPPMNQPEGRRIHCQWVYASRYDTYYIFVFEDYADAPSREARSNIQIEKL
jgi:hypothetical protein